MNRKSNKIALLLTAALIAVCLATALVACTSAHEHKWGEWSFVTEPDCTNAGERVRECSVCHEKETEPVSPLGHDWDHDVIVPASCGTEGRENLQCKRCPVSLSNQVIPATGEHNFLPGYQSDGNFHWRVCEDCGSQSALVPHSSTSGWLINDGYHYHVCTECGADFAMTEHTFNGIACVYCGKGAPNMPYTEDLDFAPIYDDEDSEKVVAYKVVGYGKVRSSVVAIPPTHLGLPVTEIGEDAFYPYGDLNIDNNIGIVSVSIPDTVKIIDKEAFLSSAITEITIPNSVTEIRDNAFNLCAALTSVTIPASVKDIPNGCFANCSQLSKVTIGGVIGTIGTNAFSQCINLVSFPLREGLLSIGDGAFNLCEVLAMALNLPSSLKNIGASAFEGCVKLTELSFGEDIQVIGQEAFSGCVGLACELDLPDGLLMIGAGAFMGCAGLTGDLILPAGLIELGNYAFSGAYQDETCSGRLYIPGSVKTVGLEAFNGCYGFAYLEFGDGIQTIGSRAFYECRNLQNEKLTIPASVETIANEAFASYASTSPKFKEVEILGAQVIMQNAFDFCSAMEKLSLPASLKEVGAAAFKACRSLYEVRFAGNAGDWVSIQFADATSNPAYCWDDEIDIQLYFGGVLAENVSVPQGIESVGAYCFAGVRCVKSIDLPDTVTSIGMQAFYSCKGLKTIDLGNVTEINEGLFNDCSNLTSVTMGDNVSKIGSNAFNRTAIENIHISEGLTSLGEGAFKGATKLLAINIPAGIKEIYSDTFRGCTALATVEIAEDSALETIGKYAFYETGVTSISLPATLTKIDDYAFQYCKQLVTVEIASESKLEYIGHQAFQTCEKLSGFDIPSTLTFIGVSAFEGNAKLDGAIVIPNGVELIPQNVFKGCSTIKSISIGDGVTTIGNQAFWGCSSATSLHIGANVNEISFRTSAMSFSGFKKLVEITVSADNQRFYADGNCLVMKEADEEGALTGETDLVLGSNSATVPSVTKIHDYAFDGMSGFTAQIALPASLKSIGLYAFRNSGASGKLVIPASVTVGYDAFRGTKISELEVRGSVGSSCFQDCKQLTKVTIPAGMTFQMSTFSGCNALATVVFEGSKDQWNTMVEGSSSSWASNLTFTVQLSDGTSFEYPEPTAAE